MDNNWADNGIIIGSLFFNRVHTKKKIMGSQPLTTRLSPRHDDFADHRRLWRWGRLLLCRDLSSVGRGRWWLPLPTENVTLEGCQMA
jgi:hypothetical protein